MLSTAVSDALKAFDSISLLWTLSDRLKLRIARYPSSDEIKSSRPKVSVSAGKTVRQMRDARLAHVSRLK